MASDFVRNIKDVRNIDILSRNTVTENDLISTTDGEVYVVTKKGYRKITNIETKDFEALKKQADTNTLNISDLTDDIESLTTTTDTNTSDIGNLKTTTDTNTSDISSLNTSTETIKNDVKSLKSTTANNTSNIETLTTSTDTNTSEIGKIETKTLNNESEISNLIKSINNLNENIKKLNEYVEVKTFNDIDLMDKNSLNTLPLGVNYVKSAKNTTEEMKTNNGWLTVHYGNNVKRLMYQPYSEGRIYYNYIWKDKLGEWQSNTKQYYTLFEGSATGVGTEIKLNDSYKNYSSLNFHVQSRGSNDIKEYEGNNNSKIVVYTINVTDADGGDGDIIETQINRTSETVFTINNEVSWRFSTQAGQEVTNGIVITKIEGVK